MAKSRPKFDDMNRNSGAESSNTINSQHLSSPSTTTGSSSLFSNPLMISTFNNVYDNEQKKEVKIEETKPIPELPKVLQDMALDWIDNENFESKDYSSSNVIIPFFGRRLPIITLLRHAVRGEYKEVNAMLKKNPLLLLEEDTVTDYSGRKHEKRTVYQIALGACDYNVKDAKGNIVVNGMVEMIEKHFSKLPNKRPEEIKQIMLKQYEGQFPEGHEEKEAKRVAADSKALHRFNKVITDATDEEVKATSELEDKIHAILRKDRSPEGEKLWQIIQTAAKKEDKSSDDIKAARTEWNEMEELKTIVQCIKKASSKEKFEAAFNDLKNYLMRHHMIDKSFNIRVLEALYQFRCHLEPKGTLTSGKHFNHFLLAEEYQLYELNYEGFGNRWNSPKNLFRWQKGLGGIECHVPACDAQIIAQGPWSIFVDGERSRRTLDFRYGCGKYFPLGSYLSWEIGHNCAAGGRWTSHGRLASWGECGQLLQNLCRAKILVPKLKHPPDNQSQNRSCSIL
jgi:hypothetical protein